MYSSANVDIILNIYSFSKTGYSPFPYNKNGIAIYPAIDNAGIPIAVTLPISIE